jgi:hypothetical protein
MINKFWQGSARQRAILFLTIGMIGSFILGAFAQNNDWLGTQRVTAGALSAASRKAGDRVLVIFHEDVIRALETRFAIEDTDRMLELLLSRMRKDVTVYPTENYYYFRVYADGKELAGNILLSRDKIDHGTLSLNYYQVTGDGTSGEKLEYGHAYSSADGLVVTNLGNGVYRIRYRSKEVRFHLNSLPPEKPGNLRLARGEAYLGPIYDESGIRFALLFDAPEQHFIYVLDPTEPPSDELYQLNDEVVVGRRTGFAFYVDKKYDRKLLTAVNSAAVRQNTYYDGPFDQLPYNYADQIDMKKYLEAAFPVVRRKIDKYGNFVDYKGNNVGVFSYREYNDLAQLKYINDCKTSSKTESKFFSCITRE